MTAESAKQIDDSGDIRSFAKAINTLRNNRTLVTPVAFYKKVIKGDTINLHCIKSIDSAYPNMAHNIISIEKEINTVKKAAESIGIVFVDKRQAKLN